MPGRILACLLVAMVATTSATALIQPTEAEESVEVIDPLQASQLLEMPSFTGTRLDGTAFDSSELAGKTVLIDFWGVWCPPCIHAFPKLSALHNEFQERDFEVVGLAVLSGTPEEVSDFLADYDVTYPVVLIETEVAEAFLVLAYPTYVIVDSQGMILKISTGTGDIEQEIRPDIERLFED